MFRVLQHYFPVRAALLVIGEAVIVAAALIVALTHHVWEWRNARPGAGANSEIVNRLAAQGLSVDDGYWAAVATALVLTVLTQICIGLNRLYEFQVSASRFERASRFVEAAGAALTAGLGALVLGNLWAFERFLQVPGLTLSRTLQAAASGLAAAFALAYVFRALYHWLVRRAELDTRVLILGSKGPAHALANQILEHPEAGYRVVGLVPEPAGDNGARGRSNGGPELVTSRDEAETHASRALTLVDVALLDRAVQNRGAAMAGRQVVAQPALGEETLLEVVRKLQVDAIVIALQDRRMTLPIKDLLAAKLAGIDVREREEVFEQVTGRIAVAAMRPSYLIFNDGFRRHPWAALAKRAVDIGVALLMLFCLWPVMLLTAIMVRLNSPGPVLFTQERVGQDGKPFVLMKFRSMRADAEKLSGPVWASEDDPRITSFGRFMRKTRLDELPQLFNVLAGSMSLVGPRPERQHFIDQLAEKIPYFNLRHIVKPGVTGWAQINYPYGNTVEDALHKLQYDLFYIKNYSVLFDFSILVGTIKTVVLRRGT
ncbi:MAG: TIGR03013 family PEP-CTERM/XrtA system glycosyltransferase [Planctomycetota bacterium]